MFCLKPGPPAPFAVPSRPERMHEDANCWHFAYGSEIDVFYSVDGVAAEGLSVAEHA